MADFFTKLIQEIVRSLLAIAFVVLLAITITYAFGHVGTPGWSNAKELVDILIPTIAGLLGSAIGFYFGTRAGQG